ncbi:MtrAB system histidine kinase MtrB [Microlunatus speluncae]|uniref:MtrAB system histidine kinase MtrB n=1 Tax=Microlunatus speluncae TaxID=2594267 RepID=UPI0012663444|nr:MtrAB system histidine kinase MtrB [Microlunatus speluncae]
MSLPSGITEGEPWWKLPLNWWSRSLPLRVISSVFVASLIVVILGGFLIMRQASSGVIDTKKESVQSEAQAALSAAQETLNNATVSNSASANELFQTLAVNLAGRGGSDRYSVIAFVNRQTVRTGEIDVSSVPQALRDQVTDPASEGQYFITPAGMRTTTEQTPRPAFAVGTMLQLPGSGGYETYLIFPLAQEQETLDVLGTAVISTSALLVLLLTIIAALVSRQVVAPVRAARRAAESLALGNLDNRMRVRGQDDLARLAASMNYMASELQKQITQLEELSAVQQRFVSDVSHELRTPLTTVRMAAEVLYEAREDFDPVSARSAELLQVEVDRFEALLTDLLEISRFDAGVAVLSLDRVDLVDVVERVVATHERFAEEAGAVVTVHSPGPCVAEVDARRIERVVRNLLTNAIEHSEGRPIDVWLDRDEDAVAIAVRDHGVGFEASQAKLVFHRFWRADPARTRTIGGTGLGLSIAMEDARLHGGWLTAWGRPGMGAQFRLTLPRERGGILEQSPLPLVPRDLVGPSVSRVDGIEFAQPLIAPVTPPVAISAVSPTAAGSPPSAAEPVPAEPVPELLDLGDHSRRGEE